MTDRPIIFSAPMIRALLDGRKSMTRRVLKPQPPPRDCGDAGISLYGDGFRYGDCDYKDGVFERIPYAPGDRLYVKEAWRAMDGQDGFSGAQIGAQCLEAGYKRAWSPVRYEADGAKNNWIADQHTFGSQPGRYRYARFMPRWASRLTLVVTDVKVERLQEMDRGDAMSEGCPFPNMAAGPNPLDWFRDLWNSLHGPDAWAGNPWVAAISFTAHRCNIDHMEAGHDA